MNERTTKPESHPPFPDWEIPGLLGILVVLFGIGLATCAWYPEPWGDEVMYTDPSVRFVQGKGFTSAAWPSQDSSKFWSGNCPLHEFLLIPWLKLFGISVTSVRSLELVEGGLAAVLLWCAARKAGWIRGAWARLGFVLLFLCSSALTFMFHYGRPDALTLLISAAFLNVLASGESYFNRGAVLALGVLVPWAGLQLGVYAVTVGMVAIWLFKGRVWDFCRRAGLGMALGVVLLLGMYATQGTLRSFIENTVASGHALSGELAQLAVLKDSRAANRAIERLKQDAQFYQVWFVDPSFKWVATSLIVCGVWARSQKRFERASPLGFALTTGLAVPIIVLVAGKYPVYYGWMGFLLVSFGAFAVISEFWGMWGSGMRILAGVPLLAAGIAGLPFELRETAKIGRFDPAKMDEFVQANLEPADVVLVDGPAYYASASRGLETCFMKYGGGRGLREIPPEQRPAFTVMIILPSNLEECAKKAGGRWVPGPGFEISRSRAGEERKLVIYHRSR